MGKLLYLFENMNKSEQRRCIFGMHPMGFAGKTMIFSCFYPCGKAGAIQTRRCQGIAVDDYGGTLGALALNRSGFCNVGVRSVDLTNNPIIPKERSTKKRRTIFWRAQRSVLNVMNLINSLKKG
jgi:hypothetical protein